MVAALLAAVSCTSAFRSGGTLFARRLASPRAAIAIASLVTSDVATVTYSLRPDLSSRASSYGENAERLIESLPFDVGDVSFVVGGGTYLEGLHATVGQMAVGETRTDVSIDAGAGEYNDGGVAVLPSEQAPQGLKAGMAVMLSVGGQQVQATVTELTEESMTLDTNPPLAGCRLLLDVTLHALEPPSAFERATFAGGCFWGLELAYQREPGVVGTAVGYTQGDTDSPTYEEVCSGATGHTEAVRVVFDPKRVSYERLCELLVERLADNVYLLNQVGNDRGTQYRHGMYPESEAQAAVARRVLDALGEHKTLGPVQTEVVAATGFWPAEDYHMQYLQKGGQNAKKKAEETIRCYG